VSVVFITVSALLGLFLPSRLSDSRLDRPWMWILVQGTLAWGLALLALAQINMTPLCIGQDNGDGNNNLALCAVQTIGVAIAYTPVAFTVLGLSALVRGAVLDRRAASRLEG